MKKHTKTQGLKNKAISIIIPSIQYNYFQHGFQAGIAVAPNKLKKHMDNFFLRLRQLILLSGDIIILYFSLFLTFAVRYGAPMDPELWEDHLWPFSTVFALFVLIFYINSLYDLTLAKNDVRFYRRFFESLTISALLGIVFFYLVPSVGIAPKTNLFLQLFFFAALFFLWRTLWNRFVRNGVWKNKIIFVGFGSDLNELLSALQTVPQYGFELRAVYLEDNAYKNIALPATAITVVNAADIPKVIKQEKITAVILGTQPEKSAELAGVLYKSIYLQVNFIDAAEFVELITGRIPTARLTEAWFLENLKESKKRLYNPTKKTIDYILAAFLTIPLTLFLPVIALLNLASPRGSLFYRQLRIGRNGKEFWIYKFRTMIPQAETNGAVFTQKEDKRVTRLGKFLRKTRIDELPQIWNILRGEMSFIGPRPERPEFVQELQRAMPFYNLRHLVKPGITGWAQINFPYAGSIEENLKKLQYDLYYVKNRSLLLDLAILLKTINIVLRWMGR